MRVCGRRGFSGAATRSNATRSVIRSTESPAVRRWLREQAGFSLLEVLIAIVLTSTVILAIGAGMLTLMRSSKRAEDRQHMQLAISSFTESIKSIDYLDCGRVENGDGVVQPGEYDYVSYPNHFDADSLGVDSLSIVSIDYWKRGSSTDPADAETFVPLASSSCGAIPPTDTGAQRFTVKLSYRDLTSQASIVKRRP